MKNQPQDDQTLPQLTNMNTHKKNEIPILDEEELANRDLIKEGKTKNFEP